MKEYDHKKIEPKWQKKWEKNEVNKVEESADNKYYCLVEFPYPSGEGLHVGHVRSYTAMDVISRKRRAEGMNVLYPIGYDSFGLPAENYAIKTGIHPRKTTEKNIKNYRGQLKSLGFSFDWSREISTSDPSYYKWTQWLFLKFFKNNLAYKKEMPINWCLDCKIGLANEEVVGGVCERCGGEVEVREKEQWMLKITEYADRLIDDLEKVDYLDRIKIQQENWIGRSEGVEIKFRIKNEDSDIKVFTTRPDTLFGATYLVLSPEHKIISGLESKILNLKDVKKYVEDAKSKTDIERTTEGREKTGIKLEGIEAINPANKEEIPIYVADYVLPHYGSGAIMAVPAHDKRDYQFANKFDLEIREVIEGGDISKSAYTGKGKLINSGQFNGLESNEASKKITELVNGNRKKTYKLRDWVFSRQRYWGEPIPIINCKDCGPVAVPEENLPVLLPEIDEFQPADSGESPLERAEDWVNVDCPKCGREAKRETDVMPNWAGSSWYYLRYTDPKNDEEFASMDKLKYWMSVDWYNGGMEHTTLHLLYSRFWHKFFNDIGLVPNDEPYKKRTAQGLILAHDGEKMSKSKGNVVNPNDIVERFGADTLRIYEMFMGPFDQNVAWSEDGLLGPRRFLEKIWRGFEKVSKDKDVDDVQESLAHKTIKKVSDDIENMKFNTAISTLMEYWNSINEEEKISIQSYEMLLWLLSPFAPHITEELWKMLEKDESIHLTPWPAYDKNKIVQDKFTIVVQVDGKTRAQFESENLDRSKLEERALDLPKIKKHTEDKEIKKIIYVPETLINIVTEN